jgi:type I restriction enzyme S subunit
MIGEGKTRGQAAIPELEAAHHQNCASIRVTATKVLRSYIPGYLKERYRDARRGGSGGQQPAERGGDPAVPFPDRVGNG